MQTRVSIKLDKSDREWSGTLSLTFTLQQLIDKFPYLQFDVDAEQHVQCTEKLTEYCNYRQYHRIQTFNLSDISEETLNELERRNRIYGYKQHFMKTYPHLYVAVFEYEKRLTVSIWVKRDGHDSEWIDSFTVKSIDEIDLQKYEEVAEQALQKHLMVCALCKKAKPWTFDYSSHFFAATYCEECSKTIHQSNWWKYNK